MNLAELERKLIAAARAHAPSDRVPYAFEKRIMAHLATRPMRDHWELWGRALWRAAAPCVAIMLVLGAWSFFGSQSSTGRPICPRTLSKRCSRQWIRINPPTPPGE